MSNKTTYTIQSQCNIFDSSTGRIAQQKSKIQTVVKFLKLALTWSYTNFSPHLKLDKCQIYETYWNIKTYIHENNLFSNLDSPARNENALYPKTHGLDTLFSSMFWAESENVQAVLAQLRLCLANTEVLIWLSLRQDQVDDGDQCREEAQDQGEVVERAHQEERVAQWVDQVDQRLGAQVCASKRALQGLSWHGSCHGSQCTQRSRSSSFQATVLLGLDEGRRHHLPAQQQSCSTQAHAQHRSSPTASHCCQDGFATNSKLPYSKKLAAKPHALQASSSIKSMPPKQHVLKTIPKHVIHLSPTNSTIFH